MFSYDDTDMNSKGRTAHYTFSSPFPHNPAYRYGGTRWGYAPEDYVEQSEPVYQRPALYTFDNYDAYHGCI